MPRFFFDLFDGTVTVDEEAHDLPEFEAVRAEIRRTLPAMLQHAVVDKDKAHFRADSRDEAGRRILTATIVMIIECVEDLSATASSSTDPASKREGC